jgi:general secretion pathway protein K
MERELQKAGAMTTNRRGVALIAALWLVVAIAAVTAQFALEARERRTIGILAAERGIQRAAAQGALALTLAKLEYSLRVAPSGNNIARIRSADPWLDIDSLYDGPMPVDSVSVQVTAQDLGARLNINQATEQDFQTFFSFLLKDYATATKLAQSIMDWRDADSLPRPSGAERDDYIEAGLLALPTNGSFRDVEDLRHVMGMTPEIFAEAEPYLTTRGQGLINLNTAPVPVLRVLPGITDAAIATILQYRSQGRRIESIDQVFPPDGTRPGRLVDGRAVNRAVGNRATVFTSDVEFTFSARVGPQAPPSKLTAVLSHAQNGQTVNITYKQW